VSNKTHHGRWGRFRFNDQGVKEKLCNGPLHKEEGKWLTLDNYFIFKKGPHKGKPENYCIICSRVSRGRDPHSGYIKVSEVRWIFMELQRRLGKTETVRRLNLSTSFWGRLERQTYFKKVTVRRAVELLLEVRANREVRHKKSIRHGAAARGHKEKIPTEPRDFYIPTGDVQLERRTKYRQTHLEQERERDRERRRRRKEELN
jgi:hypothetical protein